MNGLLDERDSQLRPRRADILNILLSVVIVLLVLIIVTLIFFVTPMTVSGRSMYPTYSSGDRILLSKIGYSVNRGDIVVFKIPGNDAPPIKRVIAMPGDVVYFDISIMDYTVNGEPVDDYATTTGYSSNYFASSEHDVYIALTTTGITVGENQLFVLGDNRNISRDSHVYGCIQADWLVGKVILHY